MSNPRLHKTLNSRSFLVAALLPLCVLIALVTAASSQEYSLPIPEGVLPPLIPDDNPVTQAKVELGQKLYFDPRLSVDDTVSCATCHDPDKGFTDGLKTSKGVGGKTGERNAPTELNAAYYEQQFWDGRAETLEDQAQLPIINPIEMGMPSHAAVEEKLRKLSEYPPLFQKAFVGTPQISIDRVGKAIASFERTLISFSAPIDRFLAGDKNAISESAKRGWALFNGKARCNSCHGRVDVVPTFTDNKYHNIGVAAQKQDFVVLAREALQVVRTGDRKQIDELAIQSRFSELGRFMVTKEQKDVGAFKTSGLRNVELTAPYMHDGSEATLKMMVGEHDWYFDMGDKWKELFGEPIYSWDHKDVHFIVLNSVVEKDFWTARNMTPMERMVTVAGLDNAMQSRFEVGEPQRDWLAKDLAKVDKKTPLVIFSHSPLYKYYRDWNFWTDDAEEVQKLLFPFQKVSVIHGHTHQLLTNHIRTISFHGMLSTAWPWPYAPTGLPKLTVQMDRADPFDQFDGCGDGTVDVRKDGQVNKNYNLWSRNPTTVTYEQLASGKPAPQGPSY